MRLDSTCSAKLISFYISTACNKTFLFRLLWLTMKQFTTLKSATNVFNMFSPPITKIVFIWKKILFTIEALIDQTYLHAVIVFTITQCVKNLLIATCSLIWLRYLRTSLIFDWTRNASSSCHACQLIYVRSTSFVILLSSWFFLPKRIDKMENKQSRCHWVYSKWEKIW